MNLLYSLAGVEVSSCPYKNVYEIFEETLSSSLSKDRKLIEIDGMVCSYSELNGHIRGLVKIFQNLQLQKGSVVALFVPNGVKRISAMLALIRSGIIFFPIDPLLSKETMNTFLEDGAPAYVITTQEKGYTEMLDSYEVKCPRISLDDYWATKQDFDEMPDISPAEVLHDDVICILFTSGSSGVPKGVRMTHGNFLNRLTWYYRQFPYKGNEILCSKTNILMVDYQFETLCPILKHMTCVTIDQEHYQDVSRFMNILKNEKINRLVLVPSLLRCLCSFTEDDRNLISLEHVVCSGETLSDDLAKDFLRKYPSVALYNFYGSTETTADVLYTSFDVNAVSSSNNSIIGLPLQNTKIYVVEEEDDESSDHRKRGELWVSGLNVAAGYFNNSETASVFLPNPFEGEKIDSIYLNAFKTGDIVEVTDNGIEFVGRKDDVVKVRGKKVSLKFVEDTMKEYFPNRQIRVLSNFSHSKSQMQLYAFVESIKPHPHSKCIKVIKDLLPDYMLPKVIEVSKMPLTPSGKIDRQALLSNYTKVLTSEEEMMTLENDYDKIRYAVSQVLELTTEEVDSSKSFFQLGGNSITSFLFLYELKRMGVVINLQQLLQASSLNDLATREAEGDHISLDSSINIVSFTDLTSAEVENTGLKFNETFSNENSLARLSDPAAVSIVIDHCVRYCKENYPTLSVAARYGNQIVGAILNSPSSVNIYPSNLPEEIGALLSSAEDDVMNRLKAENHNILESDLIFVDPTLPKPLGTNLFYFLSNEVIKIAKRDNYTAIVSVDTNPATQRIDVDVLGFVTENVVYPKQFCMNGKYPFASLDDDNKVMVNVKYL